MVFGIISRKVPRKRNFGKGRLERLDKIIFNLFSTVKVQEGIENPLFSISDLAERIYDSQDHFKRFSESEVAESLEHFDGMLICEEVEGVKYYGFE